MDWPSPFCDVGMRKFYACLSGLRGSAQDTTSEWKKQSDVMHVRDSGDHPPKEQFADAGCVEQTFPLRVAAEESGVRQTGVNETLGKTAYPESTIN